VRESAAEGMLKPN